MGLIAIEAGTGMFFAAVLLALVPGPDNLFVLTQSVLLGRWAGVTATLGFCTGLVAHTVAVALGVAALLRQSGAAFYLLYLAWRFLRAPPIGLGNAEAAAPRRWVLYRRGVVMNLTNPKVSLFFLAFLPQFTDQRAGPVAVQLILFGLLFILATLLVFGAIALLADAIRPWLARHSQAQKVIARAAALVFAGLALKLALTPMV